MSEDRFDRLTGWVGLVLYALVALFPVLAGVGSLTPWWWAAYLAGAVSLVPMMLATISEQTARWLLLPFVASACLLYAADPMYGFGAVPMVLVAACAGLLVALRWSLLLVTLQVLVLVGVGLTLNDDSTAVVASFFYAGLQLFAVLVGQLTVREREARERLAATHAELARAHADLEAAHLRLAESSRTEERLRIARDLHDLIGHQLSALAVNLEVAGHVAPGRAAEPVERSRAIAKDLLRDVRAVVSQMRETRTDLPGALADMADAVPSVAVHVRVADDIEPLLSERVEVLLRCVQEVLTNTVRHSNAANLWLSLTRSGSQVRVDARDDGHGCQTVVPGNGLTGMRERLGAAGGSLEYDGSGGGFWLRARLPADDDRQVALGVGAHPVRTGNGRP